MSEDTFEKYSIEKFCSDNLKINVFFKFMWTPSRPKNSAQLLNTAEYIMKHAKNLYITGSRKRLRNRAETCKGNITENTTLF